LKAGIVYNLPDSDDRKDRKEVLNAVEDVSIVIDGLGYSKILIPIRDGDELALFIKTVKGVDFVFNLCEDFAGKSEGEAWMAGLLEMVGVPYTGSGPEALMLALNKVRVKEIFNSHKIPTPHYLIIESPLRGFLPLRYPLIIKPTKEDGSRGIEKDSVVFDRDSLNKKSRALLALYPSLLIEEFIVGREINVAILNSKVIAIGEVSFATEPAILSYDAKWYEGSREDVTTPISYTASLKCNEDVATLARKAFNVLGLRDYGRVDFRVNDRGKPYIIDVNPNPDISSKSGFAKALKAADMAYQDFISIIITKALERYRRD
jgi:D-alanine-D-alanine ligase